MARFLVTGGCGFIGSHLCDALLRAGHGVIVLDNLSTGRRENLHEDCKLVLGDVADPAALDEVAADVDGIFHLAAIASVARSNEDWRGSHVTNQTASVSVFEAARRHGGLPVVFTSSAAIYGDPASGEPIGESVVANPLSAYGVDKFGSELHARVAMRVHGVRTVGLRPFNVYGPRQDPHSPYSGVISIFAENMQRGAPVTIFGDGAQTRDFVHVGDVVRHFVRAMEVRADVPMVFNVASGVSTSLLQLVGLLAEVLGVEPDLRFAPPRTGDIRHSLGDPTLARRVLGVPATLDLRAGLEHLLRGVELPGAVA